MWYSAASIDVITLLCNYLERYDIKLDAFKYLTFVAFDLNGISVSLKYIVLYNKCGSSRARAIFENRSKERQDEGRIYLWTVRSFIAQEMRQGDWRRLQRSPSKRDGDASLYNASSNKATRKRFLISISSGKYRHACVSFTGCLFPGKTWIPLYLENSHGIL